MKRLQFVLALLITLLLLGATAVAGEIGDVDNSGEVELKDVTILRRYLAGGYDVTVDVSASDVDGNGVVELKDVTVLRRYLAGGYGIELTKPIIYIVTGTENYGNKTGNADSISIALPGEASSRVMTLADLGMLEYAGKTDDLIDLHIAMAEVDEGLVFRSLVGKIKDGCEIEYGTSTLKIDGKSYIADSFGGKYLCNLDGTPSETRMFNDDGSVSDELKALLKAEHNTRIIDLEGDGRVDRIIVVPKVVYEYYGVQKENNVKYFVAQSLDKTVDIRCPVSSIVSDTEIDGIFVASVFNNTVYAEAIEPVDTYTVKLNFKDKRLVLKDVKGEFTYNTGRLGGVLTLDPDVNLVAVYRIARYYVYGNEVVHIEPVPETWNFAVLRDVFFDNGYYANLLTVDKGMLVLPLSESDGYELYNEHKAVESNGETVYNYGIVSYYCEGYSGNYYLIDTGFPAGYEKNKCIRIEKGVEISYKGNSMTATVGDTKGVRVNNNSSTFVVTGKNKDELICYNGWEFPIDSFTCKTTADSYLVMDDNNRATLICTVLDKNPEDEVKDDYENNGKKILFAYKDSTIAKQDNKKYNKYFFISNETLSYENGTDFSMEYDEISNPGTVKGGLYGYDEEESTYVRITDNLGLETVDYGHIEYIEHDILEFRKNELVILRSNVKIWGVADAEYCSNIKTFTYEELGKMFELVKASNKNNNRNDSIEIILLYTIDKNGRRDLCSVIVEVYVADENGNAVSVNDIIFRKYCGD